MNDTPETYKISFKRHLKMLGYAGFLIICLPLFTPLIMKLRGEILFFDADFIKIILLVLFVFEIPALILHIQYFIENYKMELVIDSKTRKIKIRKSGMDYEYDFSDVVMSKLYKSIYYKNEIDNAARYKTTFSDYGYWFLRFADGKKFYFTSLMINTAGEPLIKDTEIKYPFFSNINRNEMTESEINELNTKNFESGVHRFMIKYRDLPNKELMTRIDNKVSFQEEVIEACIRLINERSDKNTSDINV